MHYIPLIDAGVSGNDDGGNYLPYIEGVKADIFIKDAETNRPFVGKVWNYNSTVWPDHTNPKTRDYYFRMMKLLHDQMAFDGAWIVCQFICKYLHLQKTYQKSTYFLNLFAGYE